MEVDPETNDELDAQIRAEVEEWSSNSNECLSIKLIRGDGSTIETFQPEFTYPIFGEEEAIFGYRDLEITLTFAAHNLKPHLGTSYSKQYDDHGEVRPTDIPEAFRDFLPEAAFTQEDARDALQDANVQNFVPPGEVIREYHRDGTTYQIWCATLKDKRAKELIENMQVLVPMFIEGGTVLQLEQDWTTERWKVFLLYQVDSTPATSSSPYSIMGYGTSYRVFTFPDRHKSSDSNGNDSSILSPLDLLSRERLSQFLILPPYQGNGHGQELYNTMFARLTSPQNVRELTVEDPNEAFDDLRDLCDLLHLRAHVPAFAALRINTDMQADSLHFTAAIPIDQIVSSSERDAIMKQTKIMQRQFDRLVEMHTLSFIPLLHRSRSRITRKEKASNVQDKAYYLWRMYAKQRLYLFNRDQLAQLERPERIEKVEAALDSVQEGYVKMLEKVEKVEKSRAANGSNGTSDAAGAVSGAASSARRNKRKVIDDAEEEDENGDSELHNELVDSMTGSGAENGPKKARIDSRDDV